MTLLPRLLNRLAFVRAAFLADGTYRISMHLLCRGEWADADWTQLKGALPVVVVCGYGVVTKPDDSEIATRVKADANQFLWSTANGTLSFMRQERLQTLLKELADHNVAPMQIHCADLTTDFQATCNQIASQIYGSMRWRALLRPSAENSAMAQAVVRKVTLPILAAFLILLVANMLLAPSLNTRRQLLQSQWSVSERTASESELATIRQQKLLSEFSAHPAGSRAVVCDRIAYCVPERMQLTSLEIEPPAKRIEPRKPFVCRDGIVIIRGSAPAAVDISSFTSRLAEQNRFCDIRLTSVEKERDTERLLFRIELSL